MKSFENVWNCKSLLEFSKKLYIAKKNLETSRNTGKFKRDFIAKPIKLKKALKKSLKYLDCKDRREMRNRKWYSNSIFPLQQKGNLFVNMVPMVWR